MKISVIIASYNYARYLQEAIESVIAQTYQDWELLVVDDGSCDNSVDIIKSYCEKDSRIKLIQHEGFKNKGLKETIKLGLEHCTGEWVAFLESDDVFMTKNVEKKIEIINKYPKTKLVFNQVEPFGDKKQIVKTQKMIEKRRKKLLNKNYPTNLFKDFYFTNMIMTFSSVIVETEVLLQADFDTPVDAFLDWWLWVNLSYKNDFYYIDEPLTGWRMHFESYIKRTAKPKLKLVHIQAYWKIFKETKNLNLFCFMVFSSAKLFFLRLIECFERRIL